MHKGWHAMSTVLNTQPLSIAAPSKTALGLHLSCVLFLPTRLHRVLLQRPPSRVECGACVTCSWLSMHAFTDKNKGLPSLTLLEVLISPQSTPSAWCPGALRHVATMFYVFSLPGRCTEIPAAPHHGTQPGMRCVLCGISSPQRCMMGGSQAW